MVSWFIITLSAKFFQIIHYLFGILRHQNPHNRENIICLTLIYYFTILKLMRCIIDLFIFLSLYFSARDSLTLIGMIKINEWREGTEYVYKSGISLYFPSINRDVYTDIKGVYFFKIPANVTYLRGPEVRFRGRYFSFSSGGRSLNPEYGFVIFSFGELIGESLTLSLGIDYDTLLKWAEEIYEEKNKDTLLNLVRAYKMISRINSEMPFDTIIKIYSSSIDIIPTLKAIDEVFYILEERMDTNGLRDTLLFKDICDEILSKFFMKSKDNYAIIHSMIREVLMKYSDNSFILKSLKELIKKFFRGGYPFVSSVFGKYYRFQLGIRRIPCI